ncbi:bifunctional pyr operon transcriptional regulator/uracil phosphoribosyltransferase PyrR [Ornithinicoccus halotolerans]|uniref:bifunctional pyr operon transcriptional regulator/uracil phosphoribosyltransferase PyrR n=1 Tax=Ornithinicoccus halotolerans TaxID=1748220 RepID=UPI001297D1F1|nr:bifunctional pyr operon transcriptional regulator/uracil phosphoribosyltransferase PyrR [Ornithinicoccus halotolerans]
MSPARERVPEGTTPTAESGRVVLAGEEIGRALRRIAHEILETNKGPQDLLLLGIPTRGVHLARRLGAALHDVEGVEVPVGSLDVTMYRDDLRRQPVRHLEPTDVPGDRVEGKVVVLVDDVLFSGRTVRAALDSLADLGRPRAVRLAVLVDRGHRELPIRADHVGKNLPTSRGERVWVRLVEQDGADEVRIAADPARREGERQ